MTDEDQAEAIAFLEGLCVDAGDAKPPASTHISRIFFAGGIVYKLKRAVHMPYLDFSKPELRLAACEAEYSLNRRTAPGLYRGVRRITREGTGLRLDGEGALVDAVVEMNRFNDDALFDAMAMRGALTPAHMEQLARKLAVFHAGAEPRDGGSTHMGDVIALNERSIRATFLAREPHLATILTRLREALSRNGALIDARARAGKVRRCHGDLTLRNIALIDGEPTPFDCLEFNEALASIDVLYDVAFTLMDLQHRGRPALANTLFNRYLDNTQEADGVVLLPLFIALRALIRAHVTASMSEDANDETRETIRSEARAYLALADAALAPSPPVLVGIGGLSGSGKSTVAAALASLLRPFPGARVLSSDRIRKALFGAAPMQRLPPEAYAPEVSEHVYASARIQAAHYLAQGWPVITDAVFDRPEDRAALEGVAPQAGASFLGVWLDAPPATLAARVGARTGDPSDATLEVLAAQQAKLAMRRAPVAWVRMDATQPPQEIAAAIAAQLYSAGSRVSG